ncbi:MAG: hypothetical protein A2X76_04195 [Lysobacterales bacterium GWF1_69_6]|nr:MAG: hypothetical protein A2X76_04195 [Xanthomonadales bacterium GWF1_69_6]
MTTWILVADESRARLFRATSRDGGIEVIATMEHAEGRLHPHELTDQLPDSSHTAVGGIHHGFEPRMAAKEKVAREFAHELAELLEADRVSHEFKELILVADPRFLGLLRGAIGKDLSRLVTRSLARDYTQATPEQISKFLEA